MPLTGPTEDDAFPVAPTPALLGWDEVLKDAVLNSNIEEVSTTLGSGTLHFLYMFQI